MFKNDDANDLFRAMFSATSAPLLLFSFSIFVHSYFTNFTDKAHNIY